MLKAGLAVAASTFLLGAAPVLAADIAGAPIFARGAVDGVNGKIEAFAGASSHRLVAPFSNSANMLGVTGSLSMPIGHSFGLQIDGLAGVRDGHFAGGGAAHFFWRNPSTALFGVYGSYARRDSDSLAFGRLGLEGAFYMSRFTIGGIAGVERAIADRGFAFAPGILGAGSRNRGFVAADFSWYATDNLKLSVGYRYWSGLSAAAAGFEYLIQTGTGVSYSLFAEGRAGENRYLVGLAGVRVYFGQRDKTLIRRHREDDPPNYLREDMFTPRGVANPGAPVQNGVYTNGEGPPRVIVCPPDCLL